MRLIVSLSGVMTSEVHIVTLANSRQISQRYVMFENTQMFFIAFISSAGMLLMFVGFAQSGDFLVFFKRFLFWL